MAELVKKNVMVPKELEEVLVCLKAIVNAIKLGLPVSEIVAQSLPPFISAVEGAQNIPAEIADHLKASIDAGILFGSDVAFMFLNKEVPSVEEEVKVFNKKK